MTVNQRRHRVKRYVARRARRQRRLLNEHVDDPRSRRGRRLQFSGFLGTLFAGMLAGCRGMRDVEELSEELDVRDTNGRPVDKISDTALGNVAAEINPDDFEQPLVQQVRDMNRRKELRPVGLPCGVATVDGKALGKLEHDAKGHALKQTDSTGKDFWYVRVLRAVLSSAAGKPCIGQRTIPGREGEITNFPDFATWLHETYGVHGYFGILDVDAGFLSRAVFEFVDQHLGYGLVAGLKDNQPDLIAEAQRVLEPMVRSQAPEATTPWERHRGTLMRRKLYRTAELDGWLGWDNLRQVWLVVQETAEPPEPANDEQRKRNRGCAEPGDNWEVSEERRFFVSNVLWNYLTADQILLVVRNHWAVENDCFWALDVEWGEDRPAWCARGTAVITLAWLRIMAYNVVQGLRKRHLLRHHPRRGGTSPRPWRSVFRLITHILPGSCLGDPPSIRDASSVSAPVAAPT